MGMGGPERRVRELEESVRTKNKQIHRLLEDIEQVGEDEEEWKDRDKKNPKRRRTHLQLKFLFFKEVDFTGRNRGFFDHTTSFFYIKNL